MKDNVRDLSVIELCVFLIEWACICSKNRGVFRRLFVFKVVGISRVFVYFWKRGYCLFPHWSHWMRCAVLRSSILDIGEVISYSYTTWVSYVLHLICVWNECLKKMVKNYGPIYMRAKREKIESTILQCYMLKLNDQAPTPPCATADGWEFWDTFNRITVSDVSSFASSEATMAQV